MQLIEENNESIFKQYLPAIVMFAFIIVMAIFEMFKIGSPTQYDIKDSFNGIVTSTYISKSWVYVGLEGSENKQEIKNGYNYAYPTPRLINFIQTGDKVFKNPCSDTVHIIRNDKEYHFIQLAYWYNDESRNEEYRKEYMAKRLIKLHEEGCNVDSIALEFALNYLTNKKQ